MDWRSFEAHQVKENFCKSLLFLSPNVDRHVVEALSTSLGISLTNELGRYPLIHKGNERCNQGALIHKVRDKLQG